MERSYLIRYGLMGEVGRFSADLDEKIERGCTVVIRSHRGLELGEVLIETPRTAAAPAAAAARVLRPAGPDDLEQARRAGLERAIRYEACSSILHEGLWPFAIVDVEPLLEPARTVLHYLGPHHLDVAGLLSVFRSACNLDVVFQAVGPDISGEEHQAEGTHAVCGHCGSESGGCGSGGCGGSTGSVGGGHGCADCGIKALLTSRR
jgi:hypothetical protein